MDGNPQGAIDLVQMELKRPGPLKEFRDLGCYERDANPVSQMPATLAIKEKSSHRCNLLHTLNNFAHTKFHSFCLPNSKSNKLLANVPGL